MAIEFVKISNAIYCDGCEKTILLIFDLRRSQPSRDLRGAAAMPPVDAGRPLHGRML